MRRFTIVTVVLAATVAFLVGAIVAGGLSQSSIIAEPAVKTVPTRAISRANGPALPPPVVNFADVVDRINPAVVNIDLTMGGQGTAWRRNRAGLQPYDVIVGLDDGPVAGDDQLIREIAARTPGTPARLHVVRKGRDENLVVKLAERPARDREDAPPQAPPSVPAERGRTGSEAMLGLTVRDLDRQTADRLDLPAAIKGVLITRVEAMSSSFDGGIERGAVVLEINRQRVETVAEYRRIAQSVCPGDILTFYLYSPEIDQRQLKTVRVEDR